jgi:hypothetical protein
MVILFNLEKLWQFGQQNAVSVPLVFQYRMTDYFGTTSGTGLGNIGGDETGSTVNLTYSLKELGLIYILTIQM